MLEDVMQSIDVKELKKLSVKPCCSGGGGVPIASSALSGIDTQLQGHDGGKAVNIGDDCQDGSADESSEVGDVEVARRGSPVSCCCGDNRGFNVRDTQRDDMTGVVVASGGRFPCLHIGLTGLRHNRRYFLALDFVEIGGSGVDGFTPYDYTEPYYAPRPNNLSGIQWMDGVLYFSLNAIANGGLQESGTTLKVGGEYEPTLRLLELRDDQWPSGNSAIRFPLRGTAFLVVSLSSEVRMSRTALASEFLLVRRSEMSRSRFPSQQQQQQQQQQPAQQECFHSSPPSRGVFLEQTPTSPPAAPQPDWRRLLELRAGRAATASRLLRLAGATPKHHGLQALPAAPDPLSSGGAASVRTVYSKPVVHDHFTGGVWKSLPPQPAPQLPQQPVGSGAWHSSPTRQHSCLAPGAHLELGALLQGMQLNREALSSLIEQQSGLPQQQQPRSSLFGFGGLGSGSLPVAEHRPSMPAFGPGASTTAAAHALRECWSRSTPPSSSTPPLLRFNYDLLPSGYVHWLALARSSLNRPPQTMAFSALDHAQQLHHDHQQQPMQDMGVQTGYPSTSTSSEEAEQGAGDTMNPNPITAALSFAASNSGVSFATSAASGAPPP